MKHLRMQLSKTSKSPTSCFGTELESHIKKHLELSTRAWVYKAGDEAICQPKKKEKDTNLYYYSELRSTGRDAS